MRFVFCKTAVVEGQAFEAGTEVMESELRPDNFESLRRVGVLVEAPVQRTLGFQSLDGESPPPNPEVPTDSTPPAAEPGNEPKAEKKAKKKPETK